VKTAKIFKHGNSQAVRLPKEFRFAGKEVLIKHSGGGVLLLPSKLTYEQIMTAVGGFKGAIERHQPEDQERSGVEFRSSHRRLTSPSLPELEPRLPLKPSLPPPHRKSARPSSFRT
jgi:antitoxin VapB